MFYNPARRNFHVKIAAIRCIPFYEITVEMISSPRRIQPYMAAIERSRNGEALKLLFFSGGRSSRLFNEEDDLSDGHVASPEWLAAISFIFIFLCFL